MYCGSANDRLGRGRAPERRVCRIGVVRGSLAASRRARVVAALAAAALMLAPAAAHAVITPGGAQGFGNTYGQTGGHPGDPRTNVCSCHVSRVLAFSTSRHANFLMVAEGDPAKVAPKAASYWPSPTYGNQLRLMPADVGWLVGAFAGSVPPEGQSARKHRFILRGSLWGTPGSVIALSTGATFTASAPADDVGLVMGLAFEHEPTSSTNPEGVWVNESPVSVVPYFQRCGGCHVLGLTRPANATSTIGNGAEITPSTPTSYAAVGVNCENCHGTGKGTHEVASRFGYTGPGVVGAVGGDVPRRALSSDVCGQCHVAGSTTEKRLGSSTQTFSNANGYTPEVTLAAFNITSTAEGAYSSYTVRRLSMETTTNGRKTIYFYPSGHNKGMHHGYYNEWLEGGHAKSLKTIRVDMAFLPVSVRNGCLPCHSAEGYLASQGYRAGPFALAMTSSVTSDRMNIECAVCHTVHSTTTGLGLRLERGSVCQQCHTGGVADGGSAAPGEEIHHPQKEVFGGYGLIDVPTATAFMPGVDCPDCHMPETREGIHSHRFRPMLPGEAEQWGVRDNGDSCSPCHPSMTRDALQAAIDSWKGAVAAEADAAKAAITAARSRPASATSTGISLIMRAQTNWEFSGDSGAAVHNYPYILAGMRKARAMARAVGGSLEFQSGAPAISKGARAHLAGNATFGDGGAAAGETVVIEKKTAADAAWTGLSTVECRTDGSFAYAAVQHVTTQYRAYWRASGADRIYWPGTLTVGIRTKTTIVGPTSMQLGRYLTLKGGVWPVQVGSSVRVWVKAPGSTVFRPLATRRLSSSGWGLRYRPSRRGAHYYYARFAGNSRVLGSTSRRIQVLVR